MRATRHPSGTLAPAPRLFLVVGVTVLAAPSVQADELGDWVRAKVVAQSEGLDPASPPVGQRGLWRQRSPAQPVPLPGFVPPSSFAPLVRAVRSGVVNVSTRNEGSSRSLGSGFLINPDGLVVTNNHVVDRAQVILVRLADGRELEARLVGRDASTDLALLRLPGESNLPCVNLGDSDELEVGDWVVAIGSPLGLESSVTHGIISARERALGISPFDEFLQTNAHISPGSSGGPLFDLHGDVVGVTSAVASQGQGIGFAVPINLVKDLLPNLIDNGRVDRGWLGLAVQEVVEGQLRRALVVDVYAGSPAEQAGVRPGDRITAVDGKPALRYQQILRRVALQAPGSKVVLRVVREGLPAEVAATLSAAPADAAVRAMASGGRLDALGLVVRELDSIASRQLGLSRVLRIEAVLPGSPAELAALAGGDLLLEVNRQPVQRLEELGPALALTAPGETVLLKCRRGEVTRYVAIRAK